MSEITGIQIVEQARKYIGVPFQHCSHSPHGLDCVGLCIRVGHDLGITDYVPRNYSRHVNPDVLKAELSSVLDEISVGQLEPGCIVLVRCLPHDFPFHVGIFTGETFIHAYQTRGCVVEVTWGDYWTRRIERVYKWRP